MPAYHLYAWQIPALREWSRKLCRPEMRIIREAVRYGCGGTFSRSPKNAKKVLLARYNVSSRLEGVSSETVRRSLEAYLAHLEERTARDLDREIAIMDREIAAMTDRVVADGRKKLMGYYIQSKGVTI